MLPPLYLITDRHQAGGSLLVDLLEEALVGGVRMIQLREKDLSGRALFELAKEVRALTGRYGAKLLINDRVDIAMAVEADGVHLPADSFTPVEARELLGEDKIIGVSTHSVEEAIKAEEEGADLVTFSPIYETPSKMQYGTPQGLDRLKSVCKKVGIPVYALGGIKADNLDDVIKAGAGGVAMISAIFAAHNVESETKKIIAALEA